MSDQIYNVLFLCTHNSGRSIMAEAILNREARGRFRGYSAGSYLSGRVNPFVIDLLRRTNYPVSEIRSKSWDEFAGPGATPLDFVFTVCDQAAQEVCPVWPGQPMTAHWGIPDPSLVEGDDVQKALAVADAFRMLTNRIGIFVNLPLASLSRLSLQQRLDAIGRPGAPDGRQPKGPTPLRSVEALDPHESPDVRRNRRSTCCAKGAEPADACL